MRYLKAMMQEALAPEPEKDEDKPAEGHFDDGSWADWMPSRILSKAINPPPTKQSSNAVSVKLYSGKEMLVHPEAVKEAKQNVQQVMAQARKDIDKLVAGGMPIDKATAQVTQRIAQSRGLTMPSGNKKQSEVSSTYEGYSKKLFAKEGGLRYDLFTGQRKPSHPLDKLTIGQVKALQRQRKDTAAGAYQFTKAAIETLQKATGLSDNDLFDAKNQYRMFEELTRGNEKLARDKLGLSSLSDAQRYAMHFLGPSGGIRFLRKLRENPNMTFAEAFPSAYERNKALFSKIGGARATLASTFGELARRME